MVKRSKSAWPTWIWLSNPSFKRNLLTCSNLLGTCCLVNLFACGRWIKDLLSIFGRLKFERECINHTPPKSKTHLGTELWTLDPAAMCLRPIRPTKPTDYEQPPTKESHQNRNHSKTLAACMRDELCRLCFGLHMLSYPGQSLFAFCNVVKDESTTEQLY